MSLLVIPEILGLLVNTLTPDGKNFLLNIESLPQPIQLQLSMKQKPFSQFFAAFLKFTSNFKYFEQKDDGFSLSV